MANKKDVVREHTLQMRVDDNEYSTIERKAKEIGITTSNYMRMVCLHARVDISVSPHSNLNKKKEKG